MMLTSYIFKPKYGVEIAAKIITRFCNEFLCYQDEGFYVHWRNNTLLHENKLPEGYVEFWVETENGNMDAFTETCFSDEPLTAHDLTDSFFALLDDDFWEDDIEGNKLYSFYECELSEVVSAVSAENSRVVSFDGGRNAWVYEKHTTTGGRYHRIDMLEHILTQPLPDNSNRQLTLPLA